GFSNFGFLHFQPQIGAFASPFADAGEDRIAAVLLGDTRDEFLDDDGFAEARAPEKAGLSAAKERRQQIDDLDASFEDFGLGGEIDEIGRLAMDGAAGLDIDGAAIVDGVAKKIENAAESFLADWDCNGSAGVGDIHSAAQAVRGAEGDRDRKSTRLNSSHSQ